MDEIRSAGVVGGGTMGTGIAITVARSGMPTVLFDAEEEAVRRAQRQIEQFLGASVAKKKLTQEDADAAAARVTYTTDVAGLAHADVVVEAVYEDLAVKETLLRQLDEVCSPATVFLTNTSTLSITQLGAVSGRPDRVTGAHYCLPAQLMRLVEMSRGIDTSDETWSTAWKFMQATGQQPVATKDRPGFVLNHFCIPYHNDVIRMVDEGVAGPAEIDAAMKGAMGFAMGPCELLDLIGLDTQIRASEALFGATNDPRASPPPLLRRMVAAGQLGRKTNRGFYDYGGDALFGSEVQGRE